MSDFQSIVAALPYQKPFLFVDEILQIDENGVEGIYHFKKEEYFYTGHFKGQPVTPGVILTECMAQIGVVCLGIYLLGGFKSQGSQASGDSNSRLENGPPAPKGGETREDSNFNRSPPTLKGGATNARGEHNRTEAPLGSVEASEEMGPKKVSVAKIVALTESHIHFLKPVYPGEQVRVVSKKEYYRLGKLKCTVEMFDAKGTKVCYGVLSGMQKQ